MVEGNAMRVLLKALITAIACVFLAQAARSETRPEWVNSPPTPDTKYRYYVGRATGFEREDFAYREARQDAVEQAIRENFGLLTHIYQRSEETSVDSATRRSYIEESAPVRLRGFTQTASYHQTVEDLHSVWLLFRYSTDAINLEAKKLTNHAPKASKHNFSESEFTSGIDDFKSRGSLEVTTLPSGAEVYIDGSRWGETPIRLKSRLEPGLHEVEIIKDGYGSLKKKVRIVANVMSSLVETLPEMRGRFEIISSPPGAVVTIAGKVLGKTPVITPSMRVGETIHLKLTHPQAYTLVDAVELATEGVNHLNLIMQPKTTEVGFRLRPTYASIWMDGRQVPARTNGSTLWVEVPPGENTLVFFREKYLPKEVKFHVSAGQRKVLGTVSMRKRSNSRRLATSAISPGEYFGSRYQYAGSNSSTTSGSTWNPLVPKPVYALYYVYRSTGPTDPTPGDGIGFSYSWGLSPGVGFLFGLDYISGRRYGVKTAWGSSPGYDAGSLRFALPIHLSQSDLLNFSLSPSLRVELISSTTQGATSKSGTVTTNVDTKGAGILGVAMPLTYWFSATGRTGVSIEPCFSLSLSNGTPLFELVVGMTFR